MAHHRLQNDREADKWLKQTAAALDRIGALKQKYPKHPQLPPWDMLLEFDLLRQEAENLLKPPEREKP